MSVGNDWPGCYSMSWLTPSNTKFRTGHRAGARRLWQRMLRAAIGLGVLLVTGYLTLPYWIPTRHLGDFIAARMSQQMQVPVAIEGLSVDWSTGLQIHNLRIGSPEGTGTAPLAVVEHVAADFSPLTYIFQQKLKWMEIRRPALNIRFDQAGRCNLEAFARLQNDAKTSRISVRQASVNLQLPGDTQTLHLDVSDLQIIGGRVYDLGMLTMSASLAQEQGQAPISLRVLTEQDASAVAVTSLGFTDIQLDQLGLVKLLALPVGSIGGSCSGSLNLRVNARGVLDQLELNVRVQNLAVCPLKDPPLPVIAQVDLVMRGSIDPLTNRMDLREARVFMPGLDLAGKARLLGGMSSLMASIGQFEMSGTLDVGKLGALFKDQMLKQASGPLKVGISAQHKPEGLAIDFQADGKDFTLRQGQHVLKGPQTPMSLSVEAMLPAGESLDLQIQRSVLTLGGNQFIGRGQLSDLTGLQAAIANTNVTCQIVSQVLSRLKWQSVWEIHDVGALFDVLMPDAGTAGLKIEGPLLGNMTCEKQGDLSLVLTAPTKTKLSVGPFVKPAGKAMDVKFHGALNATALSLGDVSLDVTLGDAAFCLYKGHASLGRANLLDCLLLRAGPTRLGGEFRLTNAQVFAEALGQLTHKVKIAGAATGRINLLLYPEEAQTFLTADLSQMALELPGQFRSDAGETLSIQASFQQSQKTGQATLEAHLDVGCAQLDVEGRQLGLPVQPGLEMQASARVTDAAGLAKLFPPLAHRLDGGTLAGRGSFDGRAKLGLDEWNFQANVDGSGLAMQLPGGINKKAAVPLAARIAGSLRTSDNQNNLRLSSLSLRAGGLDAAFDGAVGATFGAAAQMGLSLPSETSGKLDIDLQMDDGLLNLVPPLKTFAAAHGLGGRAQISATLEGEPGKLNLNVLVQGDKLVLRDLAGLAKQDTMPLELRLQGWLNDDFQSATITNFGVQTGKSGLLASATLQPASQPLGRLKAAHISLWTKDASELSALLAAVKEQRLSGQATVEAQLEQDGGKLLLNLVEISGRQLRGRCQGKDCLLDGDFRLTNLRLEEGELPQVQAMTTDGLELRVGEFNHLWVFADLTNLPHAPQGQVQIMCERLNDVDLVQWARTLGPATQPAASASSTPASGPEEETLDQRVAALLEQVRPIARAAQLDIKIQAQRLATYDANIKETYDVRHLDLSASVNRSDIKVDYSAGLYGGTIYKRIHTNLDDPAGAMASETDMIEVKATKEMQPQLEVYFPGNIVGGFFNRKERFVLNVRDVIGNMLDPAHPLRPVGSAITVTTDGYVQGRSAPEFVTRIFPGLNLTKYQYEMMTGFADFQADGSAQNDMIFTGKDYNVYMEGMTDAANWGTYEIGLVLGGSPEWNHTWRQGRIPILKFRGRIEGGVIHDQVVSYPWPNETLFKIFLKNNVFYRMWLNRKDKS